VQSTAAIKANAVAIAGLIVGRLSVWCAQVKPDSPIFCTTGRDTNWAGYVQVLPFHRMIKILGKGMIDRRDNAG
jgi:hypothetical protein